MARSDWQHAADDDLAALGVPKHRGRAWRVLFVLVLIGTAAFVLAYYLPLYRAHAALSAEFQRLAHEHAQTRADLKLTLASLERVTKERDALQAAASAEQSRTQAGAQRLEQLQWQLDPKLKGDLKDKAVELDRDAKALRVRLNARRYFTPDLSDLNAVGEKLVCSALAPLSVIPNLAVEVHSVAEPDVAPRAAKSGAWRRASTRASNAAEWIVNDCGVSPTMVRVAAPSNAPASQSDGAPLLELSVQPR